MRLLYIASNFFLTMKLDGKVALVTGAAHGIGWEIAQALAQEVARIAICDLVQRDVDEAVEKLKLPSESTLSARANVGFERDVVELLRQTAIKFGRLDILVNNAGFAWPRAGPINLELA